MDGAAHVHPRQFGFRPVTFPKWHLDTFSMLEGGVGVRVNGVGPAQCISSYCLWLMRSLELASRMEFRRRSSIDSLLENGASVGGAELAESDDVEAREDDEAECRLYKERVSAAASLLQSDQSRR